MAAILARVIDRAAGPVPGPTSFASEPDPANDPDPDGPAGHYDFDLAEFPLFKLYKGSPSRSARDPLTYSDTITGRDGKPVARAWEVYPGPWGFGGPGAQVLLFDLLQLYVEQGAGGTQIQFGTVRSLLMRRGERNPSKRDYDRVRRDFDVLCGYYFKCKNAFWDPRRRAYVDMAWRPFGSVFFFKAAPDAGADDLPFGFVEVSPVLRDVARTRGFFSLGFDRHRFYELKPLEQRLAVYLAKQFTSQPVHRRVVAGLARALPIEAARPRDVRAILKAAAEGLIAKRVPILSGFAVEEGRGGGWVATFRRGEVPARPYTLPRAAAEELAPGLASAVERVVEAVGSGADRLWWAQCVRRLGAGPTDRALGLLKEARQRGTVSNPGGLLTKIFKDLAAEMGVALR